MVVAVTPWADPVTVMVQLGNAETPPGGTEIVKVNVVPDSVPEMLPLNWTVPAGVDAVIVPVTAEPDWETTHDIRPGPDESDAVPV